MELFPLGLTMGLVACAPAPAPLEGGAKPAATRPHGGEATVIWQEDFSAGKPPDWVSPSGAEPAEIAAVFSVREEAEERFLHARHDRSAAPEPPAVHWGRSFRDAPIPLREACHLRWRWRALLHPQPGDPWDDLAASVYVIMDLPGVFSRGKGFKLGWLARPGAEGADQRGILQIALRHDVAGQRWHDEAVDLCDLHRRHFGDPSEASILYVGVVTDADDSESLAEGDYDEIVLSRRPIQINESQMNERER